MTVNTISSVAEFETNGVTTNYPFYFKFLANEDLVVTYVDPLGVSSTLTLGTHYSVNGAGNDQGGSIVTTSALAGPGQLVVSREMEAFQQTSLRNQGKFLAETHEDVFDRLTMLIQQGFAGISRALKRPVGKAYFDAENRLISNVADPLTDQDAASKGWAGRYFGSLIDGATGLINTTTGILYDAGTLFDYLRFGLFRSVDTVGDLRLLTPARNRRAFVLGALTKGDGGHGAFVWNDGNFASQIASDPKAGLYVAASSDPTGATGAWIRVRDRYRPTPEWWGASAVPEGINTTVLPVSMRKNQAGANQDQWVLLFGDSHSWGQGSPESQYFGLATNVSVHSAAVHNKGYMARIKADIESRRGFFPCTYGTWGVYYPSKVDTGFYGPDSIARALTDPNLTLPIIPVTGHIEGRLALLTDITANTETRWYTPAALGATAYATLFREKLAVGLFGSQLLTLKKEPTYGFSPSGKRIFLEIQVNPFYLGAGAGYTQYLTSGGGIIGEKNNTTNDVYICTGQVDFPFWVVLGRQAFVPGWGLVQFGAITSVTGGSLIRLLATDGTALGGTSFVKCLQQGFRLYHPAYATTAVFRVSMQSPARAVYIAIRHKPGGGDLSLYFVDNLSSGGATDPYIQGGVASRTANAWEWAAGPGGLSVLRATPDGGLVPATNALIGPNSFAIATESLTPGVTEEIVYRIDLGATQYGDLYLESAGGTNGVDIRGVLLDNNKVVNVAMGGHSVGGWLGFSPGADPSTDHVAQILKHVPVQPSHVITQLPIVNEYLQQTPIATFKQNLQIFISRFGNHIPASGNFNAKGVDFLFFTSLRSRSIAFENAASMPITYDMYTVAAREFCAATACAFIDVEAALLTEARSGKIDYRRLYNDDIHPSDYANELIYREIKKTIEAVV